LIDTTTVTVPQYTYNGENQGFIFNTLNTDHITGYYSNNDSYSSYDSIVAVGIIPSMKIPSNTDYMAIIPALYSEEDAFCGLSISVNNTYYTGNNGRELVRSECHTISLIAWKQNTADEDIHSPTEDTIQLLTNTEGTSIIPYDANFCNGTSDGTASCIQVHVRRHANIITFWASDPYATDDDDYAHRNDIHTDRPI